MANNFLYYGDNLDILRRYIADESVDLISSKACFFRLATKSHKHIEPVV